MDIIANVHNLLLDNLPIRSKRTPSGWITFDCPLCNDTRKRAGIIQTGAKLSFHCFNCGFSTGWTPGPQLGKKFKELASKLGATDKDIHTVQMELLKHGKELESVEPDEFTYSLSKFETREFPEGTQLIENLPEDHELRVYAYSRGILGLAPLVHFPDMANRKRVVVPFFYNNELVGWSGRHIAPPNKETPKYLMNTQPGYVYNIDKFANDDREIVIVVEGLFDAILVDGVSVLGNNVTPEQAHLISKLNKRVIVCPDRDEAGKQLIEQAVALGWEVSFPPWATDIKDAADAVHRYGRLATVQSIISNATDNVTKIKVRTKLL